MKAKITIEIEGRDPLVFEDVLGVEVKEVRSWVETHHTGMLGVAVRVPNGRELTITGSINERRNQGTS